MLLRISLIAAVIAAAAALYFTFNVSGKLKTTAEERDAAKNEAQSAHTAEATAKSAEKKAKQEADQAKTDLAALVDKEKTASVKANQQQQRADRLQGELEKVSLERTDAQQKLAAFEAAGVPVEQLKELKINVNRLTAARDAFIEEKQIFNRHIAQLETKLKKYEEPDYEVKLPAGLSGKIVAVDPKYDFVVLDLGTAQGVVKDGKLAISRNGRLVAKAKVVSVEPNRCVANILPEWKQNEVLEGDQVQTGYEAIAQP